MPIGQTYTFVKVKLWEEVPEPLPEGIVYEIEDDQLIILKCLCGCGAERRLMRRKNPPEKHPYPSWYIVGNTLIPSIHMVGDCFSHLQLVNGVVTN